jgi:hypothetical protein
MSIKPIVRAILDGLKTVTRRVSRPQSQKIATVYRRESGRWRRIADLMYVSIKPLTEEDLFVLQSTIKALKLVKELKEDNHMEQSG